MTANHPDIAIGCDLGTTFSAIGICINGQTTIIANDQGNRTTPSYVGFNDSERLVGDAAKNQSAMNPTNTVYDAKRLIGRTFDDPTVQSDIKTWPFKVTNVGGKPMINVEYQGQQKQLRPEEISACVLSKMKETAESFLGHKVTKAVITVPAYFNDQQRQSTKDAAAIAGLKVLRIINEPTAAAIAYGLDNPSKDKKAIKTLMFDMGGGTHDVSILEIEDGVFTVLSTAGDTHLGGEDIDQRIVDHFAQEFKRTHKKDLSSSHRAMRRLRTAAERAKRTLSSSMSANVEIDSLIDGTDFTGTITRAKFEDLCSDIFRRALEPVEKALKDAKLGKGDIDEIVLVGGSTRIPKIQQLLSQYFNGKALNNKINVDEAVAYGAAVQAAMLNGHGGAVTKDLLLIDVCPLSLGIETAGGLMTKIIERNSPIPNKKSQIFSTYADNQTSVTIQIFQGERARTKDNSSLGRFDLTGIAPAPRGVPQIEVCFDMDADGILQVSATDKQGGKSEQIKIVNNSNNLSEADIKRMLAEAEKFKEDDEREIKRSDARTRAESAVLSFKRALDDSNTSSKLSEDEISAGRSAVSAAESWFEKNDRATAEEYSQKLQEFDAFASPLMQKMTSGPNGGGGMPDLGNMFGTKGDADQQKSGPKVEEVD